MCRYSDNCKLLETKYLEIWFQFTPENLFQRTRLCIHDLFGEFSAIGQLFVPGRETDIVNHKIAVLPDLPNMMPHANMHASKNDKWLLVMTFSTVFWNLLRKPWGGKMWEKYEGNKLSSPRQLNKRGVGERTNLDRDKMLDFLTFHSCCCS